METLKLIIASFLSPLWLCLALQCVGWVVCWRTEKRGGWLLIAFGTIVLLIGSSPGMTYESQRAREYQHRPLDPSRDLDPGKPVLAVVLGCGFNGDPALPANSRVSGGYLGRLIEGIRIYRSCPRCRLLISLSGDSSVESKHRFMQEIVVLMKLDAGRVDFISDARSTSDECQATVARRTDEQVVVVTSAGHMVRALQIFTDEGLSPVAAPADYAYRRAGSPDENTWKRWLPSPGGLHINHQWLYETVASAWHAVSGR